MKSLHQMYEIVSTQFTIATIYLFRCRGFLKVEVELLFKKVAVERPF